MTTDIQQRVAELEAQVERLQSNIEMLLRNAGKPGTCHGCKQAVTWLQHLSSGRLAPYDADGFNHFLACPEAALFRKAD